MTNQPRLPGAPPVTVQIGVPIIDIPGCVEAHLDNKRGTNDKLVEDDSDGTRVFCDGNMPSFNPINYNPEELQWSNLHQILQRLHHQRHLLTPEIPKDATPKVEIKKILLVLHLMLCVLVMWHRIRKKEYLGMNYKQ